MVLKKISKGKELFVCEACDLLYEEKTWAEKCENYCTKNNACSLEITSHSTELGL
jgi:hypothetical protein